MPIVLTLKPRQDVYVGDEQVVLQTITSPDRAVLSFGGKEHNIGPEEWVDLMKGCQVRLGKPREHWTQETRREVRVQFEAPGQLVLRGSSYRNKRKDPQ